MGNVVEAVRLWSEKFGANIATDFNVDKKNITLGINLVEEEFKELKNELYDEKNLKSLEKVDRNKATKEYADLLWVVIRLGMEMGIDINSSVDAVYNSNMSKAVTEKDLQPSLDALKKKFPDSEFFTRRFHTESGRIMHVIYNDKGKILKGIRYEEARF